MSDQVTITRIEFENVGGTESMVIEPKPLTIIRGGNGAGKSTVMKAFREFFDGGYDSTIIRKGSEKATIKVTFSDGSYGIRVINGKSRKSTVELFSPEGEKLRPAQERVSELAEGFSFDPLAILTAKKADRLKYLEEFLDVPLAIEEVMEAVKEADLAHGFNPRENAFVNIDRLYEVAYSQRTKINVEADNLRGAVQVVRQGVPTLNEDGKDWAKAEADAALAYREASENLKVAKQAIEEQAGAARKAEDAKLNSAKDAAEAEYQRAIAVAKEARDKQIAQAHATASANKETIARMETDELQRLQAELGGIVAETRAAYDQAREQLAAWNKATGARDQIAKLEVQIKEKAGRALFLTNVLKRLKDLRAEKQKSNPIPGLEVRDGEIFYEGVEFDAVNTGKRMELCIRMATLRSTKCPIIIVDDAVNIDDANWEAFVAAARQSNLQIVAARLDSGDLRIEAYDSLEVAA